MGRRHRTLAVRLTDAQLKEFSGEHLRYEMQMLFICRNILAGARRHATMEDTQRFAASLEAWAIHLRLLIDFLYDKRAEGTDAIASDFIEDARVREWKRARPTKTADLQRAADRAGTQVAHLSYSRKIRDPWDNFHELTEAISDRLKVFIEHAAPTRLDPHFVEVFRHLSAGPIDMSRLPVNASLADLARMVVSRVLWKKGTAFRMAPSIA